MNTMNGYSIDPRFDRHMPLIDWEGPGINPPRRNSMLQRFTTFSTPFGVDVVIGRTEMSFPDVTIEQMELGEDAYASGAYIQDAFSFLTPEQREFLMTGITPEQWEALFTEEEE
jgi:hypothetical protein